MRLRLDFSFLLLSQNPRTHLSGNPISWQDFLGPEYGGFFPPFFFPLQLLNPQPPRCLQGLPGRSWVWLRKGEIERELPGWRVRASGEGHAECVGLLSKPGAKRGGCMVAVSVGGCVIE